MLQALPSAGYRMPFSPFPPSLPPSRHSHDSAYTPPTNQCYRNPFFNLIPYPPPVVRLGCFFLPCLPVCPVFRLFALLSVFGHLSACLLVRVSTCLPVALSACRCVCLSACRSVCVFLAFLSVSLSAFLSACLFVLSVSPSVCSSLCCTCLSVSRPSLLSAFSLSCAFVLKKPRQIADFGTLLWTHHTPCLSHHSTGLGGLLDAGIPWAAPEVRKAKQEWVGLSRRCSRGKVDS